MYVLAMGDPVRTDFGYFGSILSGPDLEQTFLGFKADFCPDREQTFTRIIRGPLTLHTCATACIALDKFTVFLASTCILDPLLNTHCKYQPQKMKIMGGKS